MNGGVVRRRLVTALRLPRADLLAAAHAVALMVVVELLIRWVRVPRLAALMGVRLEADAGAFPAESDSTRCPPFRSRARVVTAARATRRVGRSWPFGSGTCLRESLVLGHLLRDLDPLLRIGVAGDDSGIRAHAWIELDGRPLGRGRGFQAFQPARRAPGER